MLAVAGLFLVSAQLSAHCQIPCGIYGDQARFDEIDEHIKTLEKSMNMIQKLSAEADKNYNQIVRWVMNKEQHAEKIDEIVTYYFLTQRIKPVSAEKKAEYKKYQEKVELLHHMLYYSMKSKQTTDLEYTKKLSETLKKFKTIYLTHTH